MGIVPAWRALLIGLSFALCAKSASAGSLQAAAQVAPVGDAMTFQAWKASRIDAARAAIERIQLEVALEKIPSLERAPGEKQAVIRPNPEPATSVPRANGLNGGLGGRVLRPEQRLEQAKINFEIAKDLTISVYIAVYLSQYSTRASMLEIARKMTPEEVTELLLALRGQQEPEFNGSAISSAGSSSR